MDPIQCCRRHGVSPETLDVAVPTHAYVCAHRDKHLCLRHCVSDCLLRKSSIYDALRPWPTSTCCPKYKGLAFVPRFFRAPLSISDTPSLPSAADPASLKPGCPKPVTRSRSPTPLEVRCYARPPLCTSRSSVTVPAAFLFRLRDGRNDRTNKQRRVIGGQMGRSWIAAAPSAAY